MYKRDTYYVHIKHISQVSVFKALESPLQVIRIDFRSAKAHAVIHHVAPAAIDHASSSSKDALHIVVPPIPRASKLNMSCDKRYIK